MRFICYFGSINAIIIIWYTMIELSAISKVFKSREVETQALNNITLSVMRGEFVSIMGPSGCGKSSLLNLIGLIDTPSSGTYSLNNQLVSGLKERERTSIRKEYFAFVFQSFNLIDELTVRENIELPLIYKKVRPEVRNQKVNDTLDRFNLLHRANYFPNELSGGQQQLVAIARAVISDPQVILADEPTGNLDSTQGEQIIQQLIKLNEQGTTIIMVTHSLMHAQRSQRIIHLFDGHVVTESYSRSVSKY